MFSDSSSYGPIAKLGVPHLTSHATAQSAQAHLAHLHAQSSHKRSTLTAKTLSKHEKCCEYDANHLSQHPQIATPFHEMSTYELSR